MEMQQIRNIEKLKGLANSQLEQECNSDHSGGVKTFKTRKDVPMYNYWLEETFHDVLDIR